MDNVCLSLGFYLFLQVAIILNWRKLILWDDPRMESLQEKDGPNALRNFCIAWIFITLGVMFFDVGILVVSVRLLRNESWVLIAKALPFLLIILLSTYMKTQFVRMCWTTLSNLRSKNKQEKKD